ncbi:MAG: sugar phosphate isomerase/epimerase [Myxococcales bacterium]|nr:sugar phosphate isomerase/epimerase [Myxococcales bacterium]MCB9579370.1 sugar phosphate isomerase/epimerase [Polyangiaceae bacterium]
MIPSGFRLGVMQGRLSPRPPDRLQAFPHASWREELSLASDLALDAVEWIYEAERADENPICSSTGRLAIRETQARTGIAVRSVCADYFMVHQLSQPNVVKRRDNARRLEMLIGWAAEIGARRILLPLLEEAAPDTEDKRAAVRDAVRACLPMADAMGVVLGLEMEIPGAEYASFVRSFGHPRVRAYYDTGNSAAQNVDIASDVLPLLPMLEAVHVKDRVVGGGSVPLGKGSANFSGFFDVLARAHFGGDFVLQHYFDREPRFDALRAINYVRLELGRANREAA